MTLFAHVGEIKNETGDAPDWHTNPLQLSVHYVMQLVLNNIEFHHGIGTEHGGTKGKTRVVGTSSLSAPNFSFGDHFGAFTRTAQTRQFKGLRVFLGTVRRPRDRFNQLIGGRAAAPAARGLI